MRPRRWTRRISATAMLAVAFACLGMVGAAWAWSTLQANPGNAVAAAKVGAVSSVEATTSNRCGSVALTWPTASSADRYRVEVRRQDGSWQVLAASHTTTSFTDTSGYANRRVEWRITPFLH